MDTNGAVIVFVTSAAAICYVFVSVRPTSPRSIRQRLCTICQGLEFVTNDRRICYELVSVLPTSSPQPCHVTAYLPGFGIRNK